jgi:hypothetical protein
MIKTVLADIVVPAAFLALYLVHHRLCRMDWQRSIKRLRNGRD